MLPGAPWQEIASGPWWVGASSWGVLCMSSERGTRIRGIDLKRRTAIAAAHLILPHLYPWPVEGSKGRVIELCAAALLSQRRLEGRLIEGFRSLQGTSAGSVKTAPTDGRGVRYQYLQWLRAPSRDRLVSPITLRVLRNIFHVGNRLMR